MLLAKRDVERIAPLRSTSREIFKSTNKRRELCARADHRTVSEFFHYSQWASLFIWMKILLAIGMCADWKNAECFSASFKQLFFYDFLIYRLFTLRFFLSPFFAGYGTIAPKTTLGRVVTLAYAFFGIPLTLIYLSSSGGVLARIARGVFSRWVSVDECFELAFRAVF